MPQKLNPYDTGWRLEPRPWVKDGTTHPNGVARQATPDDYGRFCEKLVARGYKGLKLHTWMPPVSWAPDVKMDLKACASARCLLRRA